MDRRALEALLELAKRWGVSSFKVEGVEVVFHPPEPKAVVVDPKVFADALANPATEDEVMFWSVGGAGIKDSKGDVTVPPLVGEEP